MGERCNGEQEPTNVEATARSSSELQSEVKAGLKMTKLSDVETYFTTSEHTTQAYKISKGPQTCTAIHWKGTTGHTKYRCRKL